MARKDPIRIVGIGLSISLIVMGCNPPESPTEADFGQPINLAEVEGDLTGDDPEEITLNLFGINEEVEGKFSQEIEVIEEQGFEKTVMLTQLNLPDDSVRGMRYRLKFEFDQSIGQWRLREASRQQSCYRNENPQNWGTEPCP